MHFSVQVVFFVLCAAVYLIEALPEVSTPNGVLIGEEDLKSRTGKQIYCFRGIPYAQPPVGKLRFKEAQPALPWPRPRLAKDRCAPCPQIKAFGDDKGKPYGDENCLCVSVHTTTTDPSAKLPVMFYIHGGEYKQFSSAAGQPEFMVRGDIVLVDVNYRLGAFGFSTTSDGAIPANLGLKDQLLALKWVKDNIELFGGDSNKITVFGDSSGGVSTHLMLLSPSTKGMLRGGISMSGTALSPWAILPQQVVADRTKALGVLVGCPAEPSDKLLECLQEKPMTEILEASRSFSDDRDLPLTPFAPVIESPKAKKPFITKHPKDLSSDLPWVTGLTSADTLGLSAKFLSDVERKSGDLEEQFDMMMPKFLSLDSRFTEDDTPMVMKKIKKFYFGDKPITKDNIAKMDDLISDAWFLKGILDSTANYRGKTYLYYYDYLQSNASNSFSAIFGPTMKKGASHGDDLLNFFPYTKSFFPKRVLSKMDIQVSEKMIHLWTTFAKYGDFSKNNIAKWDPMDKKNPTKNYLYIGTPEFKQMENLFRERAQFWSSLESFSNLV